MAAANRLSIPASPALPPPPAVPTRPVPTEAGIAEQLQRVERHLEHTQRLASLGTLAGLIAHEFNNILTPVLTYSQLALQSPGDPVLTRKALEKAVEGAQRAAEIASAILGFSRDDTDVPRGTSALASRADVAAAVKAALSCLAREPHKDGITLDIEIDHPPTGPLVVAMRPIALQQILLNLILNARTAMAAKSAPGEAIASGGEARGSSRPAAPRRLTIRAAACRSVALPADAIVPPAFANANPPAGGAVISVTDTGCGIAAERQHTIFDPHVTFGGSGLPGDANPTESRGFGLGLALCSRLVRDSNGLLYVQSRLGAGSTFSIVIPTGE